MSSTIISIIKGRSLLGRQPRSRLQNGMTATSYMRIGCVVVTLLLVMVGCSPTQSTTVHSFNAIVYGQVTTKSGTPVEGITVIFEHYGDGCGDSILPPETASIRTSAAGSYRTVFHVTLIRDDLSCSLASVELPAESGLRDPGPKEFNVEFRPEPPYDSVRVDFVLDS